MTTAKVTMWGSTLDDLTEQAEEHFAQFFGAHKWQMEWLRIEAGTVDISSSGRMQRTVTHWEGEALAGIVK